MNRKLSFAFIMFLPLLSYSQWSVQPNNNDFRIRNSNLSNYFRFSEIPGSTANFTTNHRRMRLGVLDFDPGTPWYSIHMGANDLMFHTNNTFRMGLIGNRIGINTQNPDCGIHVHQKTLKLTGVDPDYAGLNGTSIIFANNVSNTNNSSGVLDNGNYAITHNLAYSGLNFWKPWPALPGEQTHSPVLFLSGQSRVGVKTYTPTADFTVHGNVLIGNPDEVTLPNPQLFSLYVQKGILAQRLKIAIPNSADWSDYVFLPSYRLRPLHEVRDFISENGHLPEVPSANQLADEGGYDVLQMDATLLKKIEELTLYLLQLSEENEELKNRIELLEEKK